MEWFAAKTWVLILTFSVPGSADLTTRIDGKSKVVCQRIAVDVLLHSLKTYDPDRHRMYISNAECKWERFK